ncbi:hypothetical protein HOP52_07705 [Halomonas campisalis]|uniref:Uncharacterized protein n=1 Tax=Billgrantia campisalis TaxID=74661 RepID=A0ABS9P783_9GAMM|nr:hypothetical protein [Halomonas campisalis]MCG6657646.1 hypothetical protein [Halomonas campisalis]MDR5862582.1 hypothetical protein [Halomonas campisalis]
MIWHLIAAGFAGLGAAGIGLLLRFLSRKRLPRWIIPVSAGLGVLGYQIHYEYTWFSHKQLQLPDSAEVVSREAGGAIWRPWTYAFPMTTAFSVVDQDSLIPRQADEHRLVEFILYRFERQYVDQVTHQAYLMNCTTRELLPLVGEPRQPRFESLRQLDSDDPLYGAVCKDNA